MASAYNEIIHLRNHIRRGNILEIGASRATDWGTRTHWFLEFVRTNLRYNFYSIESDLELYDYNFEALKTAPARLRQIYSGDYKTILPHLDQKFCYIYVDDDVDYVELAQTLVNYAADRCVILFDNVDPDDPGVQWLIDNGWQFVYKHDKLRRNNRYVTVSNWTVYGRND